VLKQLAHTLTNKVMHTPTARMRQAAETGNHALLDAARSLLDLPKSR
jgi:glutamyl-tRNA reductase